MKFLDEVKFKSKVRKKGRKNGKVPSSCRKQANAK